MAFWNRPTSWQEEGARLDRQAQFLAQQQAQALAMQLGQANAGFGNVGVGAIIPVGQRIDWTVPDSLPEEPPGEVAVLEKPTRVAQDPGDETVLREYRQIADEVGVEPPELLIGEFQAFLARHDLPVFNLTEVRAYMDALTKRDNPSKLGWQWCPVREKDRLYDGTRFGVMSQTIYATPAIYRKVPASDFYGKETEPYRRIIPAHALRKIALIEKEFGAKIKFMVTDYVTEPHVIINPDPFLMAVIPNPRLADGTGRFVIDVWDEPGFGIGQMVK